MVSALDSQLIILSPGLITVLCSWARHLTLIVSLSTQVYKWVPANLMLEVTQPRSQSLSLSLRPQERDPGNEVGGNPVMD